VSDHFEDAAPENPDTPASNGAPTGAPETAEHHEERGFKEGVRDALSKAAGMVVEAGSMLAGNSGELVSAERTIAEADTERLIDRIDGES
jgi:hypothetical protein